MGTGAVRDGRLAGWRGLYIVLALPQWRVLRFQLSHAVWWLPANALAWAAGMPVLFIGAGAMPATGVNWLVILFIALTLVVAGAVVGALHGFGLGCFHPKGGNHERKNYSR